MAQRRRSTSSAEMKPPCATSGRAAAPVARRLSTVTVAIAITPTAIAAQPKPIGCRYPLCNHRLITETLAGVARPVRRREAPAGGGWSSVHADEVVCEHARLLVLLGRGGVVLATEEELVALPAGMKGAPLDLEGRKQVGLPHGRRQRHVPELEMGYLEPVAALAVLDELGILQQADAQSILHRRHRQADLVGDRPPRMKHARGDSLAAPRLKIGERLRASAEHRHALERIGEARRGGASAPPQLIAFLVQLRDLVEVDR